MAEINAQIALAGKPPVLPEFDPNKLFLTLGQLKYLSAETARTEAQAALAGTQNTQAQEELAASQRLRAIPRTTPVAPGGPPFDDATLGALQQGESTPAVQAPRRLTTEELATKLFEADPIKGPALAQALFANDKAALDMRLQHATFAANVFKDANNQAEWNTGLAYIEHVTGKSTEHLPQVFSPEAKAQMSNVGRSVQQEIEQKNKEIELSKQLVLKGITQDILVPEYPGNSRATGPTGTGPTGSGSPGPGLPGAGPPTVGTPVAGTERPYTAGETQAKAHFDLATASNARLDQYEAALAGGDKNDPYKNPPLLSRVVPNLYEEAAAHGGTKIGAAVGGVVGGVAGGATAGPWGIATGGGAGAYIGGQAGAVLNTVGNKTLSKERQQYNAEQLNFIEAVRGERVTREVFDLERERYFPKVGDSAEEVQRKRQVRQEALSALQIQTNRPQGMTPVGQTHVTDSRYPQARTGPATPAARSPHADTPTNQLTPAQLDQEEKWLRQQLGR